MTLGDIIREYLQTNKMTDFSRESGLSRAYAYMLMRNKNNDGAPIVPSIETIKKVAKGVHIPFDDVIDMLDDNTEVAIRPKEIDPDKILLEAYHASDARTQQAIRILLNL